MDLTVLWFWFAGLLQFFIAAANLFLPSRLNYAANLQKVSPIVRQIFLVHSFYIVLTVLSFSALCFFYASDLGRNEGLAHGINYFLALFWLIRFAIQVFLYDGAVKKQYFAVYLGFLAASIYLAFVFALSALGGFE